VFVAGLRAGGKPFRAGDERGTMDLTSGGSRMADHVYKLIELTGTSTKSMEDAVQNALARAGQTIRNMRWFEVIETRGQIEKKKIAHWQVTIKVGFTLDEDE
jgi:hypothetical protein